MVVIPKQRPLSLQAEASAVILNYPQFKSTGDFRHRKLIGTLQPTPSSPAYTIEIIMNLMDRPRVYVTDPPIVENAPHVYKKLANALCLYYPSAIDTQAPLFISKKLIPWVSAWLYFYEQWLLTGIWFGDEIEHSRSE